MTQPLIVEEFLELVQIDCGSKDERAIADVLLAKLADLGCVDIQEDNVGEKVNGNAGNVYARFPGTLPGSLMFCSHMDRMPDGYGIKPSIVDGKIVTDGTTILAADDLAGIVSILDGIRRLRDSGKPHCDIEIFFTVGEEKQLSGSRHMDPALIKSKLAFIFDSSGDVGRVVNSAPSYSQLSFEVFGQAAHAGNAPEKGKNALIGAAKILADIRDGRLDEESTANFPIMRAGGDATNIVCDYAYVKGETRSRNHQKMLDYVAYFHQHCQDALAGSGLTVKSSDEFFAQSFYIPETAATIRLAKKALANLGIEAVVEGGGGNMDANNFNMYGIESVGLSAGYGANHSFNEYLVIEELIKSGALVAELVQEYSQNLADYQ